MTTAERSQVDSNQMRSIAALGMFFLPATWCAVRLAKAPRYDVIRRTNELKSVFSMTFFDWSPTEGSPVISPWIGIYFALAAMLTGCTVCWWIWWIKEQKKQQDAQQEALQNARLKANMNSPDPPQYGDIFTDHGGSHV